MGGAVLVRPGAEFRRNSVSSPVRREWLLRGEFGGIHVRRFRFPPRRQPGRRKRTASAEATKASGACWWAWPVSRSTSGPTPIPFSSGAAPDRPEAGTGGLSAPCNRVEIADDVRVEHGRQDRGDAEREPDEALTVGHDGGSGCRHDGAPLPGGVTPPRPGSTMTQENILSHELIRDEDSSWYSDAMTEGMSLRERKKLQTRHRLLAAATELFAERGFDKVSVAEIAEAAEVSKMTVFNYFAGKEDLVLAPMEEHIGDVARAVRDRASGESVLAAVRGQFLACVERRDPSVGMSDAPVVLRVRRLIVETPALLTRAHAFSMRSFDLLAEALVEEGEEPAIARVVAVQLIGTRNALIQANQLRLLAGEPADAVAPDAVALAERAFGLLADGLGDFATRP